jgi:hypothetical protein
MPREWQSYGGGLLTSGEHHPQGAKIQYIQTATNTRLIVAVSARTWVAALLLTGMGRRGGGGMVWVPSTSYVVTESLGVWWRWVCAQANAKKEWDSAWFQVMVKGTPSGCFMAYKIIASLVEGACVGRVVLSW